MKKILIFVVTVSFIILSILLWHNDNSTNKKLDDVILNKNNNKMFAIMLEGDNGYEESFAEEWPSSDEYTFNEEKSHCIDKDGNEIKNILRYDAENRKAIVETGQTSYCYLYFDTIGFNSKELLAQKGTGGLSTELVGGLYRYQGTSSVVNSNYICFGSNEKCTTTSEYMYRIIGITEDGQLKLIKNNPVIEAGNNYFIYNQKNDDKFCVDNNCLWENSILYKRLNGISSGYKKGVYGDTNIFINSEQYPYMKENSEWYNMLENHDWLYGSLLFDYSTNTFDVNQSVDNIYLIETGKASTKKYNSAGELESYTWNQNINAKVGLLYVHDYYYAYSNNRNCFQNNCKSWLFDTRKTFLTYAFYSMANNREIMAIRYGKLDNVYLQSSNFNSSTEIYPVFYLKSNIKLDGKGTSDDPYVVKIKSKKYFYPIDIVNDQNSLGLSTIIQGDMYRYQGTNEEVNNYICFGTDNSNDCKNNATSENMYRVIGITSQGNLKLIKNTPLVVPEGNIKWNSISLWNNCKYTNCMWPQSDIFKRLNGLIDDDSVSNIFINSEQYPYMKNGNKWYDIIENHTWMYGDINDIYNKTADEIYKMETGQISSKRYKEEIDSTVSYTWDKENDIVNAKIGLMYLHDYYYAPTLKGGICSGSSNDNQKCMTSWLNLKNNTNIKETNGGEWSMVRSFDETNKAFTAFYFGINRTLVSENLAPYYWNDNYTYLARPVFYLKNDTKLSGSGSLDDPFIINFD